MYYSIYKKLLIMIQHKDIYNMLETTYRIRMMTKTTMAALILLLSCFVFSNSIYAKPGVIPAADEQAKEKHNQKQDVGLDKKLSNKLDKSSKGFIVVKDNKTRKSLNNNHKNWKACTKANQKDSNLPVCTVFEQGLGLSSLEESGITISAPSNEKLLLNTSLVACDNIITFTKTINGVFTQYCRDKTTWQLVDCC